MNELTNHWSFYYTKFYFLLRCDWLRAVHSNVEMGKMVTEKTSGLKTLTTLPIVFRFTLCEESCVLPFLSQNTNTKH